MIFGGGRLKNISKTTISLDWGELCEVYDEANANKSILSEEKKDVEENNDGEVKIDENEQEQPKRRTRRKRDA